jgi:hypothetical protein
VPDSAILDENFSGATASTDFLLKEKDPALKKQSNNAHKLLRKIEADYEKEEEQMMIRLIKIRGGLWT